MAQNTVIRTNILALNSHRNLGLVGKQQATSSQRLSSGFRINSAADDAAGLAISEKMRAQIRGLDQAERNTQDAISLIQTAEGGMQEIDNMVQRIRELIVYAANDHMEQDEVAVGSDGRLMGDRQKVQDEINQIMQEIDSMADRVEFNKKRLIDGTFAIGGTAGGGAASWASRLAQLQGTLTAANVANETVGAAITAANARSTDAATNRGNVVTSHLNANSGAMSNFSAATVNSSFGTLSTIADNTDHSANAMAAAARTGITNAITAIATAAGNSTLTQLQFDTLRNEINLWIAAAEDAATSHGLNTDVGQAHSLLAGALRGIMAHESFDDLQIHVTRFEGYNTASINASTEASAATRQQGIAGDGTGTAGALSAAQSTFDQHSTAMASHIAAGGSPNDPMIGGGGAAGNALWFQIGANAGQGFNLNIGNITNQGLGLAEVRNMHQQPVPHGGILHGSKMNVVQMTGNVGGGPGQEGPGSVTDLLNIVDVALARVSTERAKLGAAENRLNHTSNSLKISSENLSAAESRVRNTDMGLEMMRLTQANILQQAAISMLAQGNMAPQSVLQLLG